MNNIKKFKIITIFILFLSIICFIACNDNILSPEESSDYFPLQIGNEWTFQFPAWTPTSGDTLINVDYEIIKKKQIKGKDYYGLHYPMPFFPTKYNWIIESIDTVFIRQDENGDILFLVDSTEYPFLAFSHPFMEGDTNLVQSEIGDLRHYYTTESIDETVDTPIGKFTNCRIIFNYYPQIKGTEHRIFFAPGYGPVKIYYPELDITYQLVKINILNK